MSLPGFDDWLDNYGNPGIEDEEGQEERCLAFHCPPNSNGVCEYPKCTPEYYGELKFENDAASDPKEWE
jgi:hypothetical protein